MRGFQNRLGSFRNLFQAALVLVNLIHFHHVARHIFLFVGTLWLLLPIQPWIIRQRAYPVYEGKVNLVVYEGLIV